MVALVSVETVLLVLLIVLVAALLRSHAELLRRLGPEGTDAPRVPEPPAAARGDTARSGAGRSHADRRRGEARPHRDRRPCWRS